VRPSHADCAAAMDWLRDGVHGHQFRRPGHASESEIGCAYPASSPAGAPPLPEGATARGAQVLERCQRGSGQPVERRPHPAIRAAHVGRDAPHVRTRSAGASPTTLAATDRGCPGRPGTHEANGRGGAAVGHGVRATSSTGGAPRQVGQGTSADHARQRPLTERELQTLGLLFTGLTEVGAAERLGKSLWMVKNYRRHAYQKLGARSRAEARARLSTR
jgi:DNA-binding CsgD family transcriptional regulator